MYWLILGNCHQRQSNHWFCSSVMSFLFVLLLYVFRYKGMEELTPIWLPLYLSFCCNQSNQKCWSLLGFISRLKLWLFYWKLLIDLQIDWFCYRKTEFRIKAKNWVILLNDNHIWVVVVSRKNQWPEQRIHHK